MGLEFYTGLNAVPGDPQKADIFNKTAINADQVKERIGFYGLHIATSFDPNIRSIPDNTFWPVPFDSVIFDTNGFFNPSHPDRIIIPPGFSYYEIDVFAHFFLGNWRISLFSNTGAFYPTLDLSGSCIAEGIWGSSTGTNKYTYQELHAPFRKADAGEYLQCAINVFPVGPKDFDQSIAPDFTGSGTVDIYTTQSINLMLRAYK